MVGDKKKKVLLVAQMCALSKKGFMSEKGFLLDAFLRFVLRPTSEGTVSNNVW